MMDDLYVTGTIRLLENLSAYEERYGAEVATRQIAQDVLGHTGFVVDSAVSLLPGVRVWTPGWESMGPSACPFCGSVGSGRHMPEHIVAEHMPGYEISRVR